MNIFHSLSVLFILFSSIASADSESLTCKLPSVSPASTLNCDKVTPALCAALKPTEEEVQKIIFDTLSKNTHTLNRKVYLYHYGENPDHKIEAVDLSGDLAQKFFFDKSSHRDFFDRGHSYQLYTANNPIVSLDYASIGGASGLLLRLGIPAGVNFLEDGILKTSPEDDALIRCYFGQQSLSQEGIAHGFSATQLLGNIPSSREMLQSIFKKLKIQLLVDTFRDNALFEGCAGQSPEIKVIDPALASEIEITVLSPKLEANPAPEKLAVYKDVLKYFDSVDFPALQKSGQGDSVKNFIQYYQAWAPTVYSLAPGMDAMAFQRNQYLKTKASKPALINGMFGCSKDPKYKDELQ
jgi:hypothetical protein